MIENINSLLIQTVELLSEGEIKNNISFNRIIDCKYRVNSIVMNAQECRTLTATCMHDSCACIAWLTVYACSMSGILNYIPCTWTWLWYCSSLFRVSASSRSRGKVPGYVTIQTESYLNWGVWEPCKHRLATAAHYYSAGQDSTWPLFLYVWYT